MRKGKLVLLALVAVSAIAWVAKAAVPASYTGRVYPAGGSPKEIPGRINFHDYDLGGRGLAWVQDDVANDPISGGCTAGGRDSDGDAQHPAMAMTNHESDTKFDTFYAVGATSGVRYPSPDTSFAANDWYIGACHPNNWFNITVHVSKPGKYWISSIWAAMNDSIISQIYFLGTQYATTHDTVKTNVFHLKAYNTYHGWRPNADFSSITLDSGVQVMTFYNQSYHLNQDFLYFAADSGIFPTGVALPAAKTSAKSNASLSVDRGIIRFNVSDAAKTKIAVYDCLGREMMTLLDKTVSAGAHSLALNESGLKRGIYFVRMEHNGVASVAKFQCTR